MAKRTIKVDKLHQLAILFPEKEEVENNVPVFIPEFNFFKPGKIEIRPYAARALVAFENGKNYGLVMDTGLGKTYIAYLQMDRWLLRGKVLFCAPSKPLCRQVFCEILEFSKFQNGEVTEITGKVSKTKRAKMWENAKIIIATPQTIYKKLETREFSFEGFAGVVLDEIHHAVEKYAYLKIANLAHDEKVQIIGLSASPASNEIKMEKIRQNLCLDHWLDLTTKDKSLRLFSRPKKENYKKILPDENLKKVEEKIKQVLQALKETLSECINLPPNGFNYLSEEEWKKINNEIEKLKKGKEYYKAKKYSAALYKLWRGYQYLVGENYQSFIAYFGKMRKDGTKAAEMLLIDETVSEVLLLCEKYIETGQVHPKLAEYLKIIEQEILQDHSILVFVRFAESNKMVTLLTNDIGVRASSLFGQKYMKQKEQEEIIKSFKNGDFPVLIATPIAHEGLHLPQVDAIIEYSVPLNEIEMKQRQGRCGREKPGEIWSLVMDHPVDQVLYFASRAKKQRMENGLAKRGKQPVKIQIDSQTVTNSPFSKKPSKQKEWANSLSRGLIYERFCIAAVDARVGEEKLYVSMILGDKTGVIKGFVWCREAKEAQEICARIKQDDVVVISGEIKKQGDYPTLHIDLRKGMQYIEKCPEKDFCLDDYRRDMVCESAVLWEKIESAIVKAKNNFLKKLLQNIFQHSEIKEKFLITPAAVFHHHNFKGGLAMHTCEMLDDFEAALPYLKDVNIDLARCGILLHDLGKIKTYRMGILAQKLAEEITVGHIAVGLEMIKSEIAKIDGFPSELAVSLLHIIESHHGESAKVTPQTPEAILVSQIDDRNVKKYKSLKKI